jgi:hypothetical protein
VQWHVALLAALAEDAQQSRLGIKVRYRKGDQFGHAQPAGIEQFEHGPVAKTQTGVSERAAQKGGDLLPGQDFGQLADQFGAVQQGGGTGGEEAFLHQKIEKTTQTGEVAGHRRIFQTLAPQMNHIKKEGVFIYLVQAAAEIAQKFPEEKQIRTISCDGFFGQAADDGQVLEIGVDFFVHSRQGTSGPLPAQAEKGSFFNQCPIQAPLTHISAWGPTWGTRWPM